jgi:hypothetical protein
VNRWRQWLKSVVLLCLGLMPAGDACCFAADPPAAQARAAPAPQKADPQPAKPAAKRGTLLKAIVEAIGNDQGGNVRRVPVNEDPNIRNLVAQFRPQFQQLLYLELAFLRRECKPDAKPFAEVAKAAKAALDAPLRVYASQYWAMQNGRGRSSAADPRPEIRKLLMPLVEAKLGPEKARLYQEESDKRAEARKHAVVVNLVAAIDERLVLTAPQRAKLVQSLSANYDSVWEQYVEMFSSSSQNYLPSIRKESIVPLLNEQQKSVWRAAAEESGRISFGFGPIIREFEGEAAKEIQEIAHIIEEAEDGR